MDQFELDNKWQREMRDAILVPGYYERYHSAKYELLEHTDPRAAGGCDTIASGKRIDEKIVRWPKERGEPYTAFALEVRSCTVPGYERDGWMKTNTVDFLLYCFASGDEKLLICYLIDFPALQRWFYSVGEESWPLWTSTQSNRTQCRVVPINDVLGNVTNVRLRSFARPPLFRSLQLQNSAEP